MIETYLLEYFLAIYEEGNLLKASEKLHVSQPSLTRAIKKLEDELGIPLFERTPNKIKINENAKEILPYIKDILKLHHRLDEKANDLKKSITTITLGSTGQGPYFRYQNLLIPTENLKINSRLDSEVVLINEVISGSLDFAFINNPINIEGIECEKIMSERLYIMVPKTHFLANLKDGLYFKDADGQSFLVLENVGIWEDILDKHFTRSRLLRQDRTDTIHEIAKSSTIPCFASSVTINTNLAGNTDRVFLPFLDDDAVKDFYLIYQKRYKEKIETILK